MDGVRWIVVVLLPSGRCEIRGGGNKGAPPRTDCVVRTGRAQDGR